MAKSKRKIGAGDLETDPFKHGEEPQCFLAGFFDGERFHRWWGPDAARDFIRHVLSHWNGIIYFHNGGNFDFHFFLDHLPLADCEFFCIGKRIVKIKCGDLELRDSWAIIPHPLRSWKKTKIDISKLRRDRRQKHRAEIESYWRDDCRNLHEMVTAFIDEFGMSLTLASTAFRLLRTQFGVKILRTTKHFDRRFRRHYFAGRVQYFSLGRHVGHYKCVDINSAFPHAATLNHWYSAGFRIGDKIPKKNPEQCFYVVECIAGGALAQRGEDKSVNFPLGHGTYFTNGWELLAGIKAKVVKKLKVHICFQPKKVRDFGEFVRYFYNGKKDAGEKAAACLASGDDEGYQRWKGKEFFYKIILNAMYGKWGQDHQHFRDVAIRPWRSAPEDGEAWSVSHDDETRGITFYEKQAAPKYGQKEAFYNVAVAGSITGFVRSRLWASMRQCAGVLYCDTDSIVAENIEGLTFGGGLGEWKLEREFDVFWVGGKKLYVGHDAKVGWKRNRPADWKKTSVFPRIGKASVWIHVKGLGWTRRDSFKVASKGVNLKVEDLIAVCEGQERTSVSDAPTYSTKRATAFTKRRVRRADKR